jgi:hypothetical protein
MRGTPYWIPENNEQAIPGPRVEEYTDALFPVFCEWVKSIPKDCFPCDLAVIHIECVIKARHHLSVRGQTTRHILDSAINTIQSKHDSDGDTTPLSTPLTQRAVYAHYQTLTQSAPHGLVRQQSMPDVPPNIKHGNAMNTPPRRTDQNQTIHVGLYCS